MVLCLPVFIVLPSGSKLGRRVRQNLGILGILANTNKISSHSQYYSSSNFVVKCTYVIIYLEILSRNSVPLILLLHSTIYLVVIRAAILLQHNHSP